MAAHLGAQVLSVPGKKSQIVIKQIISIVQKISEIESDDNILGDAEFKLALFSLLDNMLMQQKHDCNLNKTFLEITPFYETLVSSPDCPADIRDKMEEVLREGIPAYFESTFPLGNRVVLIIQTSNQIIFLQLDSQADDFLLLNG